MLTSGQVRTMTMLTRIKHWAHRIKRDVFAVYFAARNEKTPRFLRWFALAIAAYALSPIDLIPDFIPILGYLDDLILVPVGVWLIIRWLPMDVLAESREQADKLVTRPSSRIAAGVILGIWMLCLAALAIFITQF